MRNLAALIPALFLWDHPCFSGAAQAQPLHGISMHGTPALPADFRHLPYVNPDVKKAGVFPMAWSARSTSLNPFVLKGMRTTARAVWDPEFGNLLYEPLMLRSSDEPFILYWPAGRNRGVGRGAKLRPVQHQPQGKMVGWRARHA